LSIRKIAPSIALIDTVALGQPETVAVYVVKGDRVALVDCGYTSSYREVLRGLDALGIRKDDVNYIIPTHVHLDHSGGASPLLENLPNAQVLAHERGVPHLIDPTRLIESATGIFGEEMIRLFGTPRGIPPEKITPLGEETHLNLGDNQTLSIVYAPGHAPHQVSVLVDKEGVLLTADAVGIVYPGVPTMIPTTPPPSLDPVKMSNTLGKLRRLGAAKLLVPHYGVRLDVESVLETTETKTLAWLSRMKALKAEGMTLEQMIPGFQAEVVRDAGMRPGAFPQYANLSIRITLMGMLHYLERNPSA
jgi:glyoxylase-like metal-dependent hydrolase (beta-lactamase superfamily II)